MRKLCLGFTVTFLFAVNCFANSEVESAIHFPVEKYQLKNGLTVILSEDHRSPIISYHQWFRVGSADERPGRTGLAHLFEHMMFKGTKKVSGPEFERLIQSNGATNNAFTSHDYTGYYINLPSNKLELAMQLESDRMRNLVIDPKDVQSEREVVKEERRVRVDNSVSGYLSEAVYRTVFKVHPYRWPIAGSLVDINAASIDDMRSFYNSYYAPNNATLVIVGDFESEQAKKLITKYYEPIAPEEISVSSRPVEPEQRATRRETLLKPVQNETFSIAYKGSKASTSDHYALDLLASILADGRSSRFYKKFVYRDQLASSINAWSYTPRDPGMFQIYVSVKPGKSARRILQGIYREIAEVRKRGVTEKELTKAKNQVMMSFVDGLKTVSGKAQALAASEVVSGSYEQVFKDFAKYQQVTREQVQTVANKYLTPERRSLVLVKPRSSKPQAKQKSSTQQKKGA